MRMQIYFSDEESDFVKKQPKGYVRSLVQADMAYAIGDHRTAKVISGTKSANHASNKPAKKEIAEKIPFSMKGDGLTTCKSCGSILPFYKGKCKNC